MSINFGLPVNTDLASGVLAQLRENISSILTQTMGSGTNVPTGSYRISPTTGNMEYYNGSTWSRIYSPTAASGGSANAQTLTLPAAISAYADFQRFIFPVGYLNTSSCTLNVNSLGAITIYDIKTGAALIGNEMLAGTIAEVIYYNTKFYLVNGRPGRSTWTPTWSASGSMTVGTITNYQNDYTVDGNVLTWRLGATFTLGGTASISIYCTLPKTVIADQGNAAFPVVAVDGGATLLTNASYRVITTTQLTFGKAAAANWTLGAGAQIFCTGQCYML